MEGIEPKNRPINPKHWAAAKQRIIDWLSQYPGEWYSEMDISLNARTYWTGEILVRLRDEGKVDWSSGHWYWIEGLTHAELVEARGGGIVREDEEPTKLTGDQEKMIRDVVMGNTTIINTEIINGHEVQRINGDLAYEFKFCEGCQKEVPAPWYNEEVGECAFGVPHLFATEDELKTSKEIHTYEHILDRIAIESEWWR